MKPRSSRPEASLLISSLLAGFVIFSQVLAEDSNIPVPAPVEVLRSSLAAPPVAPCTGEETVWWTDREGRRRETSCRVWQSSDGRRRTEFKSAGKDTVRIVQREGRIRYTWDAEESSQITLQAAVWQPGLVGLDLIAENYHLGAEDTLYLGRSCIVISATAKAEGRPSLKVVVDAANRTALALEVTSPTGENSYGFRFDSISFDDYDEAVFEMPAAQAGELDSRTAEVRREFAGPLEAVGEVPFEVLECRRPPAGFSVRRCVLEGQRLRVTYSDGLASVSVYLENARQDVSVIGDSGLAVTQVNRNGRLVTWARRPRSTILSTTIGGTTATVIGDIHLEELIEMCFSLAPVD